MSITLAAAAQFCATSAIAANRQICCELVSRAAKQGAKMIFLPEASDFISSSTEETLSLVNDASFVNGLQSAAKEHDVWVSVGIHESEQSFLDPSSRVYNTHLVINSAGEIVSRYRKLHLFNVDIKDGPRLMESHSTRQGESVELVSTPLGRVGLQVCYDLRFAELSILQRQRGADILTFPSAFTVKTGMAHWEPLLRARAIETQTYVIAAAQVGVHNPRRSSYGHAMIVDPWGTVLAQCPETVEPTLALAPINLDMLQKVRTEMPVMEHRRTDIYPSLQ